MPDYKQCEFYVVRYVPDVVKGEFVNLGVVLLEKGSATEGNGEAFTGVRFTRDWRRVRCLDAEADVAAFELLEEDLRRLLESRMPEIINYRGPMSPREWMLDTIARDWSGTLQLTPAVGVLTESPEAELGLLAQAYLASAARERRVQSGRRFIYAAMREAFERTGVWNMMWKDIAVAQYTATGDPLKIDCAYRPMNEVIHMFHAVSLATAVDSAKVLAFSYQDFREGLAQAENASPNLYAVVEDGLDRGDEQIDFALTTFDRYGIDVATISQMPAIAERARLELRL